MATDGREEACVVAHMVARGRWMRSPLTRGDVVRKDRFRIPDIMPIPVEAAGEQIVRTAPLLCIEVLSPGDTLARIGARIGEYFSMGVPAWIIDPLTGRAWTATPAGIVETTGVLGAADIEMPLSEVLEQRRGSLVRRAPDIIEKLRLHRPGKQQRRNRATFSSGGWCLRCSCLRWAPPGRIILRIASTSTTSTRSLTIAPYGVSAGFRNFSRPPGVSAMHLNMPITGHFFPPLLRWTMQ